MPNVCGQLYAAPEAIIAVEKWRTVLPNPPLSEWIVAVAIDDFKVVTFTVITETSA